MTPDELAEARFDSGGPDGEDAARETALMAAHGYRTDGGTMEDETTRPGGWVDGIGWVALLRTLAEGDVFRFNADDRDGEVDDYWLANDPEAPVIVTRWADDTVPAPPPPPEQPQPDGPWQVAPWNPTDVLPVEWCPPDPLTDPETIAAPFELIHCTSPALAVLVRDLLNASAALPGRERGDEETRFEVRCERGDCPFCVTAPGIIRTEQDAIDLADAVNGMTSGGHLHEPYALTVHPIPAASDPGTSAP